MKPLKPLLKCCVLFAVSLIWLGQEAEPARASASEDVFIQVNDQPLSFETAKPFVDGTGRVQVPLRFLSEQLGYHVVWKAEENSVHITRPAVTGEPIEGTDEVPGEEAAGGNDMLPSAETSDGTEPLQEVRTASAGVNEETAADEAVEGVSEETGPDSGLQEIILSADGLRMEQGRLYVPLRTVAEQFLLPISWEKERRVALISTDGLEHAPARFPEQDSVRSIAASATQGDLVKQVLTMAKSFSGTPYVWGGTTPGGFDCSGYVQFVFAAKGISLPRTSKQMYAYAGVPVANPKVGDLVFFSERGTISHVGIYIGNRQFISATSSRGVHIAVMSNGYWGNRYTGAKRIL